MRRGKWGSPLQTWETRVRRLDLMDVRLSVTIEHVIRPFRICGPKNNNRFNIEIRFRRQRSIEQYENKTITINTANPKMSYRRNKYRVVLQTTFMFTHVDNVRDTEFIVKILSRKLPFPVLLVVCMYVLRVYGYYK